MDLILRIDADSNGLKWETVTSFEQLEERIKYWSDAFLGGEPLAVNKASRSTHWYFSPRHNTFGPSKFIGYDGLTFEKYESSAINGITTQNAIKKLKLYRELKSEEDTQLVKPLLEQFLARQNKRLKQNAVIYVPKSFALSSLPAADTVIGKSIPLSVIPALTAVDTAESYTIQNIINDGAFISEDDILRCIKRLKRKKNLILQGPPGTGKTWLAKRLGFALMGEKSTERLESLQFHPNLSYEDFVRGFRPEGEGKLSLLEGPLMKMVENAKRNPGKSFVMVIEEINRGNPAQIFGEMLTLLEADKRVPEEAMKLSYGSDKVYVPENLHIIGTMNLADRSLALVDLALRRRFAFVTLTPQFNTPWREWVKARGVPVETADKIQNRMAALNKAVAGDNSLGEHFQVGHSYLTPAKGEVIEDPREWFMDVVRTEIEPLLEEYWFDRVETVRAETKKLTDGF